MIPAYRKMSIMAVPNSIAQYLSNRWAGQPGFIALFTGAGAGTTGSANEASGGGYARQAIGTPTPDGVGDNSWSQVDVPCGAGDYTEGGLLSTLTASQLSVPTGLTATAAAGGSLTTGVARYYKLTAFNWAGETTASTEASATPSGSNLKINIAFSALTGVSALTGHAAAAAGFKLYVGTASGAENLLLATLANTATTYVDDGSVAGASATLPVTNTASTFAGSNAFAGGTVHVSGTGASINVAPSITV